MLKKEQVYEMDVAVKKEIVKYCRSVFKTYVLKNTLKQFGIQNIFFLEMLYNYSKNLYEETGDFSLNISDFEQIYSFLRMGEETMARFQSGQILLVGVDEYEQLHFNFTPQLEANYNENKNIWEQKI